MVRLCRLDNSFTDRFVDIITSCVSSLISQLTNDTNGQTLLCQVINSTEQLVSITPAKQLFLLMMGWVHYYMAESKWLSVQWKHMSSPSPKKFKVQLSADRGIACVLSDRQGVVLVDFMPRGHNVNADYYLKLLSDRLRPAVCK